MRYVLIALAAIGLSPAAAQSIIPSVAELMTPLDVQPVIYKSSDWSFPTSLTAHTWQGYFNLNMKTARHVLFRVNWSINKKTNTPVIIQVVHCDNGPANCVEMGRISSANWPANITIWNTGVDITSAFNQRVAAKVFKNIGWRVKGDGLSSVQFFDARLEMQFQD